DLPSDAGLEPVSEIVSDAGSLSPASETDVGEHSGTEPGPDSSEEDPDPSSSVSASDSVPELSSGDPSEDAGESGEEPPEESPSEGPAESSDTPPEETDDPSGPPSDDPGKTGPRTITFVSLNDLHGHIEQDENGRNGIANTARGVDKLSKYFGDDDPDTDVRDDLVLFANGDMFQGTSVSNRTNGLAVVQAMNLMRFDAMGVGNHEFDWQLETILAYWDGDRSNGEADFPLISANIQKISAGGELLADLSDRDGVVDMLIVEKEGIRVGLIGVTGPLKGSILASAVADYDFADVTDSVERAAGELRRRGAELICVSIHDGNAGSVLNYEANRRIAELKDAGGRYLVDVIFNGHTHTMQNGEISRPGGASVPVVQAGANNSGYGYAVLTYDPETKAVSLDSYGCLSVADLRAQADSEVAEFVRRFADDLTSQDEVLAVSGVWLQSKRDYAEYVGDIMIRAFGADYSIGNYGGLRGTGGIVSGTKITLSNVYEMIPFDNRVYVVTIPGKVLYDFYYANESYYYLGQSDEVTPPAGLRNSQNLYTLAIIDYVYTSSYFSSARAQVRSETDTGIILRDLLAEDIRCYGRDNVLWSPRKGPRLAQVYTPS
ncbi:MAG: bifunctional metallophosphatase/5'-nucleotidase, partial [Clostridia bacterium]|nr:bifunctional metallophosphatase/5'-nucleotidase [Clostridia bacterium]